MIKILIISLDPALIIFSSKEDNNPSYQFITYNSTTDPLDIMAQVCSINPSVLILDDDFIKSSSVQLMKSIYKANPKLKIIFITSNSSIELGRKIHSIGVMFYIIKPISEFELGEFLKLIEKEEIKTKSINKHY